MRPHILLFVCVVSSACLPDEHDPGEFALYVDISSGVGPLDRVQLVTAPGEIHFGGTFASAPVTPAMLATGEPPPDNARFFVQASTSNVPSWSAGATSGEYVADLAELDYYGVAIGSRRDTNGRLVVVAVGETPTGSFPDDHDSMISVTIDQPAVEVWGTGCLRIDTGHGVHYVIDIQDYDCDGIPAFQDCKPTTYCGPGTTPAALEACVCD
jgi:hypothetical protein